jgi:hypothetical protein
MGHRVMVMARDIQILKNGMLTETLKLTDGTYRIGRDPSSDIVLTDTAVSKTHAILTIENDHFIIKDPGSANGIFHQGKKITEQTFKKTFDIEIKPFILRVADAPQPKGQNKTGNFLDKLQTAGLANIKASIFALVFAIMLLTLMIGYLPLKSQAAGVQRREILKTGVLLARYLAEMNRPFLADDTRAMVRTAPVSAEDGVIYAVVVDADGRIIAPPEKQGDFFTWDGMPQAFKDGKLAVGDGAQNEKIIFYPLRQQTRTLGAAIVGFAGDQATGGNIGMGATGYFLLIILFGLSMLVAYLMAKTFLNPLITLNEHVEVAIKEGRGTLDFHAPYQELDHLKRSFDRLLMRKPASTQTPTSERVSQASGPSDSFAQPPEISASQKAEPAASHASCLNDLNAPWCIIDRETYTLIKISDNFAGLPGPPDRKEGMHVIEAFDADMIQAVSQLMETKSEERLTIVIQDKTFVLRRMDDPAQKNNVILVFEDTPS